MSDKCSKYKVDFVISKEGVKCAECGELYHLKCLTVEQGKKTTRNNITSSTSSRAGEGGQSTVLQAIAAFRAEVSDFRKESSEKWDKSWEKLAQLQSDLKKVTTEIDVINVEFLRSDISVAHRLQGRSSDTRPLSIVVSFVSRLTKAMWMSAARERKGLLASDIHSSFPTDSKVFINKHLTTQTRQLFNGARELVRQRVLSVAWTNDGRVLAKSTPGGATFRIQHQDQLEQMKRRIMELTTQDAGGQTTRRTDTVPAAAT
ncbi:hypothetical protein J6590_065121 [Homalodisca vitripennis]|nr:hypothetical protein J6590_065121 [Homalodisca vitripennis]